MKVWESTLDQKFACFVEKTDRYQGKLVIQKGDTVLFTTPVVLSYDAAFGPDIADIKAWMHVCTEFVDKL